MPTRSDGDTWCEHLGAVQCRAASGGADESASPALPLPRLPEPQHSLTTRSLGSCTGAPPSPTSLGLLPTRLSASALFALRPRRVLDSSASARANWLLSDRCLWKFYASEVKRQILTMNLEAS